MMEKEIKTTLLNEKEIKKYIIQLAEKKLKDLVVNDSNLFALGYWNGVSSAIKTLTQ